jgi:LysR family transcriptional regulator, transcription activator of glutamate synthase operon
VLEKELGVEVFRRTSRSVELTAEGRVILGYAQRVLAEVDVQVAQLEEQEGIRHNGRRSCPRLGCADR